MARKKTYTPQSFESCKPKDVSANIYVSMLQSKAWQNLSNNARVLYLYMKAQMYGQKPIKDQPEQYAFYFNRAMYTDTYHLYTNNRQFYKDKQMLIDNGFIEQIESGKNTRTKNIYKFSSKWQTI